MRIFHEETEEYRKPEKICSGDEVRIVLQKGSEEKSDWTCYVKEKEGKKIDYKGLLVAAERAEGGFIYSEYKYRCEGSFFYYFAKGEGQAVEFYGKNGIKTKIEEINPFYGIADYSPPEWARGAIWYQIMPDSFYNGNLLNDKLTSGGNTENAWGNTHFGGADYFGGDLKGILKKLPYIASLGVNVIGLNPIWLTTHQAGYGAYDPTQIDSAFGNEQDLIELVEQCHSMGIRVVLDAVFQYFNNEGIWSNDSGYFPLSADAYASIFVWDLAGKRIESPWKAPLIDFSSDLARDLIYRKDDSILQRYLKEPYNCDGWRLDVGNIWEGSDPQINGNSETILTDIRNAVKGIGQEKLLLTEHDCGTMMLNHVVDTKWNYDLGWRLRSWVEGKISATEMAKTICDGVMGLPRCIADCSYNHLTTHDTKRIKRYAGKSRERLMAGILLYMTIPGSPCIYYGDETGMEGIPLPGMSDAAPVSFSSMNWDESEWDREIFCLYRGLGALRKKKRRLFSHGSYRVCLADDKKKLLIFARYADGDFVVTAVNQTGRSHRGIALDLRCIGEFRDIEITDYITGKKYAVKGGFCEVDVAPGGSVFSCDAIPLSLNGLDCNGDVYYDHKKYIFRDTGAVSGIQIGAFHYIFNAPDKICLRLIYGQKSEIRIEVFQSKIVVCGEEKEQREEQIHMLTGLEVERDLRNIVSVWVTDSIGKRLLWHIKTDMPQLVEFRIEGKRAGSFGLEQIHISQPLVANFVDGASCMFTVESGERDSVEYGADGVAVRAEEEVCFRSLRRCGDFCWTAEYSHICGRAGVFVGEDKDNCIALIAEMGKVSCVIRREGEEETVNEIETGARYFRLEKAGTRYRALSSVDGKKYTVIAECVPCNYSRLTTGLLIRGEALCSCAAYGSGTIGAECEKMPQTIPHKEEFSWKQMAYNGRHLRWLCEGGKWKYVFSGIEQCSESGGALCSEDEYGEFRLEFTYERGSSECLNLEFLPYRIQINSIGEGMLYRGEKAVCAFHGSVGEKVRYLVTRDAYRLKVYEGQDCKICLNVSCDISPSKVRICGTKGTFKIYNYNLFHAEQDWALCRGKYLFRKEGLDIDAMGCDTAFCMYSKHSVGEMSIGVNLKVAWSDSEKDGYLDLIFSQSVGRLPNDGATMLRIDPNKMFVLMAGGKEIGRFRAEKLDYESFSLGMIVRSGAVEVWVKEHREAETKRVICAENASIRVSGLAIRLKGGRTILSHFVMEEGGKEISKLQTDCGRYVWVP